jgi:hypothetical protein
MASKVSEEKPLRWTLTRAAKEFQVPRETLRRRLGDHHQETGPDGCFSTRQVVESIYGDLHREKIRTQRALSKKLELENAITTASVLNRAELRESFCGACRCLKIRR